MDGVGLDAECFAGETAVINSKVPLQQLGWGVALQLSVICEWSGGTIAPPWPVGLCCSSRNDSLPCSSVGILNLGLPSCSTATSTIFLGSFPPLICGGDRC